MADIQIKFIFAEWAESLAGRGFRKGNNILAESECKCQNSRSDVREIASIAFGRSRKGVLVAIRVYSDGAGNEKGDGIITVGGYMADADLCESIENEWRDATGGKVFHLADFGHERCRLGSHDWPENTRDSFLKRLATIVNRDGVTIFSGSIDTASFNRAISNSTYPGEIGPAFSACAWGNMSFTEFQIMLTGDKAQYVFELGDREHEMTNVFKDIQKNDAEKFGLRSISFQPKETTLLQPADLIAGMVQRCMVKARTTIPLVDNGLAWIKLELFSGYYDSSGITAAAVKGHDGDSRGCRVYTAKLIEHLDYMSSSFFRLLPSKVVEKRKKRFTYKPRKIHGSN